jgi:Mitochondrial branched-chain alpha-ketoacid dehydrogenase kinase
MLLRVVWPWNFIQGNKRLLCSSSNNTAARCSFQCRFISVVVPQYPTDAPSTSTVDQIPPEIAEAVQEYSRIQPTSVSLQMLMKTGRGNGDFWGRTYHSASNKRGIQWGRLGHRLASDRILLQMATYLRHELPVRLAHRIQDLDQCPHMRDTQAVRAVKAIYINSFRELVQFKPQIHTLDDEQAFANLLTSLYQKHAGVLVQMAKGAFEFRAQIRKLEKQLVIPGVAATATHCAMVDRQKQRPAVLVVVAATKN